MFLIIILLVNIILRPDCGSNLPVVPYPGRFLLVQDDFSRES